MAPFSFALCADDYALTPGVSEGILACLEAGRITATSVMTTRPHWRAAAPALRAHRGRADIGLHVDLTLGPPLGKMPKLAPDRRFEPLSRLVLQALGGRIDPREVRAELGRQLDAFAAEFGRPPDYVDGHQHVHLLPGIRGAVLDELSARGLAGKIWLRGSADGTLSILTRKIEARKALIVAGLGAGFATAARSRGFVLNRGFAGFSAFDPARPYVVDFASYLRAPGPAHLVMCHPGRSDESLARLDPATASRDAELAFLLSDEFTDLLGRRGARLARMSELLSSRKSL